MGWPGLASEVQEICRQTGLPDVTVKNIILDKASVKDAIKIHHLNFLKDNMSGQKLERMKMTDMRERRPYTKFSNNECRMAFRLEVQQFDCRANMPTRYKRDLRCRACGPEIREQGEGEQNEIEQNEVEQNEDKQKTQEKDKWKIEDQEHLEICPGHRELWEGLGPTDEQSRIRYFMRLKVKKLKKQQQQEKEQQQQEKEQKQQKQQK